MKLRNLISSGLMAAVFVVGLTGSAAAAPVNTNGSFESGVDIVPSWFITLGAGDSTSIDNWIVESGTVDYIGTYWNASDGDRSLDLTGSSAAAVSQTFATVVGHTYVVTFDLAGNPAGGPVVKTMEVDAGGAAETYTFDTTGKTLAAMGWEQREFTFTATDTTTTLTFTSQVPGFFGPALDNVVVNDVLVDKNQCKNDGWMAYSDPSFRNQGDCVSYLQSSENALGNRKDN